jgi:hypothetical protein
MKVEFEARWLRKEEGICKKPQVLKCSVKEKMKQYGLEK